MEHLSLLVIGAHPDDPEWYAGGLAAYYVAAGHTVRFLALTNGDAGHYQMRGEALASRRYGESQAAGKVLGVAEYAILNNHDGTLTASFEARLQVIAAIRRAAPDLIVCHRRWDYHPDHRAAGESGGGRDAHRHGRQRPAGSATDQAHAAGRLRSGTSSRSRTPSGRISSWTWMR